jgi:hypothetical protein
MSDMMNWFRRGRLPAGAAPQQHGQQHDHVAEAEPTFSRGSDGRVYYMGASDRERLRPIFLRDPRALKEEARLRSLRRDRHSRGPQIWTIG